MATWMVVEDEPDIYDVLLAMFELWGIEGAAFVDGAEAVEWIEEVDRGEITADLPELAILDIRLPEVSGPDIGARLRKSEKLRGIAIVLVTAYRLKPEDEVSAKTRADADLLLYKPLPPMPEFRKILDQIIEKRKQLTLQQVTTPVAAVPTVSVPAPAPVTAVVTVPSKPLDTPPAPITPAPAVPSPSVSVAAPSVPAPSHVPAKPKLPPAAPVPAQVKPATPAPTTTTAPAPQQPNGANKPTGSSDMKPPQ